MLITLAQTENLIDSAFKDAQKKKKGSLEQRASEFSVGQTDGQIDEQAGKNVFNDLGMVEKTFKTYYR